jgi:hypothetical protein
MHHGDSWFEKTKTAGQGRQGTNMGPISLLPNADDMKKGCLDDDDGIEG